MFTTKHKSFLGWLGVVIGVFCWMVAITLIIGAFHRQGDVSINRGAVGLFTMVLNVIGVVSGIVSIGERDVLITPPIVAMALNGLMILAWIVVLIIS